MRLLSRRPVDDPRFLLLTGSVQQERAQRLLGMRPAAFRPQHSHKLGEACVTAAAGRLYTHVLDPQVAGLPA
jgi:hypothetical protein